MAGRASALAVLGLPPSADPAAIEQAYKKLIKQHHPDREGGDASRAAEINRAYRELRGAKDADPLQLNELRNERRKRRRWPLLALVAGIFAGAVILMVGPSAPLSRTLSLGGAASQLAHPRMAATTTSQAMNEQLHVTAIDEAVRDAVQIFRTKDEMALADASHECERRFRETPGTVLLDRCAAFDDAVVGLEDRDPLRDEGPFAALAVTGRQWSAASALSDDDLAIDSRLDRIRLRVELALAALMSPTPQAVAAPAADSNSS
jgi:hypothetical protein